MRRSAHVSGGEREKSMRLKRSVAKAAVVVMGVAVAGLALAIPASAASPTSGSASKGNGLGSFYSATADNTNNSLTLSAGTSKGSTAWGDHVDLYEYNTAGNMFQLYTNPNSTFTWHLPQDVSQFRVCGPNGFGGDTCSGWTFLSPA
jgi:hypothetical protein